MSDDERTVDGQSAGIYVHVPFCLTRCGYCDFNAYAELDHLSPLPDRRCWRRRRSPPRGGRARRS